MTNLKKKGKIDVLAILLILMLVVLIGVLISSIFSTIEVFKMPKNKQSNSMSSSMSRMSLTGFDKELARQLMDQNHDGRCDVCGMPVEQCIDGGQLQCSMDPNSKIGILGSQHIHADWKIYIDGKALDEKFFTPWAEAHESAMRNPNLALTSSFMHVHEAPENPQEKAGDVLHMHATGVPLWIFFKSIGMNFDKNCITLDNKEKFCNAGDKKLKFFVNGKENNEFENYVFNKLDKILISYGNENQQEIQKQLNLITDFAKNHSK